MHAAIMDFTCTPMVRPGREPTGGVGGRGRGAWMAGTGGKITKGGRARPEAQGAGRRQKRLAAESAAEGGGGALAPVAAPLGRSRGILLGSGHRLALAGPRHCLAAGRGAAYLMREAVTARRRDRSESLLVSANQSSNI